MFKGARLLSQTQCVLELNDLSVVVRSNGQPIETSHLG
jgi:hypothetical protein